MLSQNSLDDAICMERLIEVYGDSGGEFLFDANYLLGPFLEKSFESGLFSTKLFEFFWHVDSDVEK